jgi:hypothetical protein
MSHFGETSREMLINNCIFKSWFVFPHSVLQENRAKSIVDRPFAKQILTLPG